MKNKNKNDEHDHDSALPQRETKYYESFVRLSKERAIFINTDFTKEMASGLTALLLHYDNQDPTKDIIIYINSHGGDVAAILCIYDVIQMINAPVKTVGMGKVYSAGAFLLCAGTAGKRYVYPNAEVMIHKLQVGFPILGKTSLDQAAYLETLNDINNNLLTILSAHTGQTIEKIKEDFTSTHDIFLDAKQTVAYGLADHIL